MINDIEEKVCAFSGKILCSKNHRYKSWEHCYSFFKTYNFNDVASDEACLHLGFYLASWGMYRGSSFILDADYTIYRQIIAVLFEDRYSKLWNLNFSGIGKNSPQVNLLFQLKDALIKAFRQEIINPDDVTSEAEATDTLVTKILLGTMGCTPAYDRFFRDGCRKQGIKPFTNFTMKSYLRVIKFYQDYKSIFDGLSGRILVNNVPYPVMKLVDMYFWQIGYERWQGKHLTERAVS